jgi:PilZ domain
MAPLRELRVPMQLEVRVWGMDVTGKPFFQTARTAEVSAKGARLEGITCLKQVGDVIGVQYRNQKARFRVVWIGVKGTPEEGQIGIACLDSDKCIWAEALQESETKEKFGQGPEILSAEAAPATPTPPPATTGSGSRVERRRYPRYQCTGAVQLSKEGTDLPTWVRLTDIGLGGCYVETLSPVPLQTTVDLVIDAEGLQIRGLGKVRTLHPSVGNGIAFTQMKADDWQRLHQLIARLAAPTPREVPAPAPAPAVATVQAVATPPLEALLQLLEKKGVLTREEFLAELTTIKLRAGG